MLLSQSTLISREKFPNCQVNLGNTAILKAAFKGGDIQNSGKGDGPSMGGLCISWGDYS